MPGPEASGAAWCGPRRRSLRLPGLAGDFAKTAVGARDHDGLLVERVEDLVDQSGSHARSFGPDHLNELYADTERQALSTHDYPKLFELGAHPFLTLTLFIAMFERDHEPMGFQTVYAWRLSHFTMPYPDIAT